jgi:hypothetical protein
LIAWMRGEWTRPFPTGMGKVSLPFVTISRTLRLPVVNEGIYMPDSRCPESESSENPRRVYLELKGDLQRVLSLPLAGEQALFREVLVGYLMVEHGYPEARARHLVAGNEAAILVMLTEERDDGLW